MSNFDTMQSNLQRETLFDTWELYILLSYTDCEDGYFGAFCDGTCDKKTGHCPSGCGPGWTGNSCQIGWPSRTFVSRRDNTMIAHM